MRKSPVTVPAVATRVVARRAAISALADSADGLMSVLDVTGFNLDSDADQNRLQQAALAQRARRALTIFSSSMLQRAHAPSDDWLADRSSTTRRPSLSDPCDLPIPEVFFSKELQKVRGTDLSDSSKVTNGGKKVADQASVPVFPDARHRALKAMIPELV